jgi:hypothetical protein
MAKRNACHQPQHRSGLKARKNVTIDCDAAVKKIDTFFVASVGIGIAILLPCPSAAG